MFSNLFILLTIVTLTGAGCGGASQAEVLATKQSKLVVWGVYDSSDAFRKIMDDYQTLHRNVSFEYRELRFDEYEEELVRAFAEGRGPDIYGVHNTWIGKYQSLMQPMPDSVKIPFVETRGTIKKETFYTLQEKPTISLRALKSEFVDVVINDVVRPYQEVTEKAERPRVFGLPLSVDTMALYYNKDLLDAAGFPEPPKTWVEFQAQVTKLSKIGVNNTINQSGAAIGTYKNVERSFDILSLLMMQNGVAMENERHLASFASGTKEQNALALDAIRFYTDFANPLKEVYTWNEDQLPSFDAFVSGKTAFFFGYAYHAPLIKAASPKLKYSVASMPQIENSKVVNYANYWVQVVAKATPSSDWAWDFIQFAVSKDHVVDYLTTTKKPTARRDLISTQIEDEDISAFVSQTLTAASWYKGKNAAVAEKAFGDLMNASLAGEEIEPVINLTQNKINQTF